MSTSEILEHWTEDQAQMLLGTLLGDGNLQESSAAKKTAIYNSRHGWCRRQYNQEKHRLLREFATKPPRKRRNAGYGEWSSVWRTRALTQLHSLYTLTYPNGRKRVTREWLDLITPKGLAWWVCDDGSLNNGRHMHISTHGFEREDVELLAAWMEDAFGVAASVNTVRKKGREYPVLCVSTKGTKRLIELIEPHVPECMRYKVAWDAGVCALCGGEVYGNAEGCSPECVEEIRILKRHQCYEENKEVLLERQKAWKAANRDVVNANARKNYWKNPEKSRATSRKHATAHLEKHRDEVNERKRARRAEKKGDPEHERKLKEERAAYYQRVKADPKRLAERRRKANERRRKTQAEEAEYTREWRKNNPEKAKAQRIRDEELRRERMRDPEYRKKVNSRRKAKRDAEAAKRPPVGNCASCGAALFDPRRKVCLRPECKKSLIRDNQRRYEARKRAEKRS